MDQLKVPIVANPWQELRRFTQARIALGRAGVSIPTQPHLDFQLAHAQARDAVHHALAIEPLCNELVQHGHEVLSLQSLAPNRQVYLQRPDFGRQLSLASRQVLDDRILKSNRGYDVVFVIADGLSALAIEENAVSFLNAMLPKLASKAWQIAPLIVVEQGRVAVGDEIGAALQAQTVVVLIGERPGLSSPDSMGVYLTYNPKIGTTDAQRNCISNIRPAGMSYEIAAHKLHYLMTQSRRRQLSGVQLKDESDTLSSAHPQIT